MPYQFDQLLHEPDRAFWSFRHYADLGPKRSLPQVAATVGRCAGTLRRWSVQYKWNDRVKDYDRYMANLRREGDATVMREKSLEWGKRQADLREKEFQMCEKLIATAEKFLANPDLKGTLRDVAYALEMASKLGRLGAGMATDQTEHTGADGGPIQIEFMDALRKIYGEPVSPIIPPRLTDIPT